MEKYYRGETIPMTLECLVDLDPDYIITLAIVGKNGLSYYTYSTMDLSLYPEGEYFKAVITSTQTNLLPHGVYKVEAKLISSSGTNIDVLGEFEIVNNKVRDL